MIQTNFLSRVAVRMRRQLALQCDRCGILLLRVPDSLPDEGGHLTRHARIAVARRLLKPGDEDRIEHQLLVSAQLIKRPPPRIGIAIRQRRHAGIDRLR